MSLSPKSFKFRKSSQRIFNIFVIPTLRNLNKVNLRQGLKIYIETEKSLKPYWAKYITKKLDAFQIFFESSSFVIHLTKAISKLFETFSS